MADPVVLPSRSNGFRLSELVLLIVVLLALGLVLMPRFYDDRRADNERQAQDVLRMIASSQEVHRALDRRGEYVELYRLQVAPGEGANDLEPLMPFLGVSADFAHYTGYRFQELTDGLARPVGCRAEPRTPPFSGKGVWEIRYGETEPQLVGYLDVNKELALP